ncbi:MAG: hypothetical protein KBG15_22880, partial [Kofleriaceae bacterium]|nr:hypothetical protein [Kofleriaceae bacterium]
MRVRHMLGGTVVVACIMAAAGLVPHQALARNRLLALAPSNAASTRIAATPAREVLVPAGQFQMGVDPDVVDSIAQRCAHDLPAVSIEVPIRIGASTIMRREVINELFCDDYKQELLRQSPRVVALDSFFIDRFEVTTAAYR